MPWTMSSRSTWSLVVGDEPALRVDPPRLREPGQAVAAERGAGPVVDDRVRHAVALDEPARVRGEVLRVDAEHHDVAVSVLLPDLLEHRRLLLARLAPGGPEVEDDGLPAQRRERDRVLLVAEHREVERGRRGRLAALDRLHEAGRLPFVATCHASSATSEATTPIAAACRTIRVRRPMPRSSVSAGLGRDEEDRRPDPNALEEPLDLAHVHADAAVRGGGADRARGRASRGCRCPAPTCRSSACRADSRGRAEPGRGRRPTGCRAGSRSGCAPS